MAKVITRKQLWEYGLHLEWAERGTWMQFNPDVDMSAEVAGLEEVAARIMGGGRWRAGLDSEE